MLQSDRLDLPLWYSTIRLSSSKSVPYTLQAVPASVSDAVKPLPLVLTSLALYPGHESRVAFC